MSLAIHGISLSELAAATAGKLFGADTEITGVSTDSRTVAPGDIYFCLSGEHFDGHDYAASAIASGAVAVVAERKLDCEVPQIVVADSRRAFGLLAGMWRESLPAKVIGVTGSNGKTTVKQLLTAICKAAGTVHSTRANDNNDIGVPQTLLGVDESDRYAVVEMGANQLGEIAWLGKIAKPDIAIITNVSESHLEGFGSLDAVAREKSAIYSSLAMDGTAIVNLDDQFADDWLELNRDRSVVTFGSGDNADLHAEQLAARKVRLHCNLRGRAGSVDVECQLSGAHNLMNVAAATAAAVALGLDLPQIARAIATVDPIKGRLNFHHLPGSVTVIDDTYNANPASTKAAIEVLLNESGNGWLVLGDLKELGDDAAHHHSLMGKFACERGVHRLFAVGPLSHNAVTAFGENAEWFDSKEKLFVGLQRHRCENITILVKGSRSMSMDVVVESLIESSHSAEAAMVGGSNR